MPKTITTKTVVYKFSELEKEKKDKVLDGFRNINLNGDWWFFTKEKFEEEMKENGFEVKKIYCSGFCSQGDGACFEGVITDLSKYLKYFLREEDFPKFKKMFDLEYLSIATKHSGRYYHENCMYVSVDETGSEIPTTEEELRTFTAFMETTLRDKARELYKMLEKQHDDITSDEEVISFINDNDYVFTSDGERFNG